jgi:hypothetical protein
MKKTFKPFVSIQLLTNGDLEMSLTPANRQWVKSRWPELQTTVSEIFFVQTLLEPMGYRQILPHECGALTDATLITDGKEVWGDMNYQVLSFLEELVNGNKVFWQKD